MKWGNVWAAFIRNRNTHKTKGTPFPTKEDLARKVERIDVQIKEEQNKKIT